MENLLKDLLVLGNETKMTSVSETASVEVSGKFIIEKGNFKQEFSYWARTYDKLVGFAKIDDYETEEHKCSLGELPIDSLSKFTQSLHDSGLDTIANAMGFSNDEVKQAMCEHIQQHKIFKAVYGKKVILWDRLTQEEQQRETIAYVLANYDTCGDWQKRECKVNVFDEEGNVVPNGVPSKEILTFVYGELTK
jgi:hypothetical protein